MAGSVPPGTALASVSVPPGTVLVNGQEVISLSLSLSLSFSLSLFFFFFFFFFFFSFFFFFPLLTMLPFHGRLKMAPPLRLKPLRSNARVRVEGTATASHPTS